MIKKIIMICIPLIILNCTALITDPDELNDIGDGSLIHPDVAITDQSVINVFLEQHNGIYYATYEDGSLDMRYRIEGSDIYSGYGTQINAVRTLFGSKLQIYIEGQSSSTGAGYEMNDEMFTFNFGYDGNIYLFANAIFHKDAYSSQNGYGDKLGSPISALAAETGNYYYYDYDNTKKYYILIDSIGQVYIDENFNITYSKDYYNGNVLTITYTQPGGTTSKQDLHFYNDKLIFGNTWINDQLQYEKLTRYDIFTPYNGTYTGGGITLTVGSSQVTLTGVSYGTPVMSGNKLIIYQYSSRYTTKEYKFVFSYDKQTVTYTQPDGTQLTLNKN